MGKKVRISDESVNCYGTRILTQGIDFARYAKNPVLLYMHDRRDGVVGLVKNLEVKDGELLGELEFDCASELSQRLKKQYEFGSMRMVSGNFQILETSDDKELALDGQTAQTITRCRLFEVSAVDIGGNDNAIVLSSPDGVALSLDAKEGADCLPLLNRVNNNPIKKENEMDLKELSLKLGLKETATETEVNAKIESLKLAAANLEKVKDRAIALAVETAVKEKRIDASMHDHFVELGKMAGVECLQKTLSAIKPQVSLSAIVDQGKQQQNKGEFAQYTTLHAVPGSQMQELIDNHHDEYVRLFKAEYGIEPENI